MINIIRPSSNKNGLGYVQENVNECSRSMVPNYEARIYAGAVKSFIKKEDKNHKRNGNKQLSHMNNKSKGVFS